jgi:hypothetical protein
MELSFIMAEHMPELDTFGGSDLYCKIQYAGVTYKTPAVEMTKGTKKWEDFQYTFMMPIEWPP